MTNKRGENNLISQLGSSLIDSDVSINNMDSESNSQIKQEFSPIDLQFLNDDSNSNDFCKGIDDIEISDIDDKLEGKQRMRKAIQQISSEQPNQNYNSYLNQLQYTNHPFNYSSSSHNSQHSQYSNKHKNFKVPNQIPSSNTSSHYNSVHSCSSFPYITLTPPLISYPYYANQYIAPLQQPSLNYHLPQSYGNYNNCTFNSSNCIIPYTGFIQSNTILPNHHYSSSQLNAKQLSPLKLKNKSATNTKTQFTQIKASSKNSGNVANTNSNPNINPKEQEITLDSNTACFKRNVKSKDHQKFSETSINAYSFHSEDATKEKLPLTKNKLSAKKFLNFLCTPKGCRYFQSYIQQASPEVIDQIVQKIGTNFPKIMTDHYSNYFFQKFIKLCNLDQRMVILNNIKENILLIASDNSGTHSLQVMFEHITANEEILLLSNAISDDFLTICKGLNSNHIIQVLLVKIAEPKREVINNLIIKHAKDLIYNPNGICVIKKFLTESSTESPYQQIWDVIKPDCLLVMQDQYGNYIIQLLLELGKSKDIIDSISCIVLENLRKLTLDKISSNVVERCLEFGSEVSYNNLSKLQSIRGKLITQLFSCSLITTFLKSKYSKYVMRKAISFLSIEQIDSIAGEYKFRISQFDLKDQKNLRMLLEKLVIKRS